MTDKIKSINIDDLKPGMRPGKTLITLQGEIIVRKGEPLDKDIIQKIKVYFENAANFDETGLKTAEETAIFSIDGISHYMPPKISKFIDKTAISIETHQQAISVVSEMTKQISSGGRIDIKSVEKVTSDILDNILGDDEAALNLLNIQDFDDYTYTHSVNVAAISLLIGSKMGLSKKDIMTLGQGALMHDLGKIKTPIEILNKASKLTDEEFLIMKNHAKQTHEILTENHGMASEIINAAGQHHEKYDGSGYPFGYKGEKIDYLARIISIADVYDALTTSRVYRKALLPAEAIKIIIAGSGTHFDAMMITTFLKTVSMYPVGTYVRLNTGEIAVVKKVEPGNLITPEVLVISGEDKKRLAEPYMIKLIQDKRKFITGAIAVHE